MLTGDVTLRSGMETFSGGWSLNLDFEFVEGIQDYAYINIQNLWHGFDSGSNRNYSNYQVGDTLWTSDNLPTRMVAIPANAEQVIFKVSNTGHGQGNTLNAAEFRPVNHTVQVAGQTVYTHNMWKDDCDQNPCSPQNGNWEYGRAGWCPGQEVAAVDFDITDHVTPGEMTALDYVLDPYLNKCSPLYPTCNPATDCAFGTQIECGYDGQLHTPPTYKMAIQLIIKSNSPLTSVNDAVNWEDFRVFPNPSNGNFNINVTFDEPQQAVVNIIDTTGKNVFQQSLSPGLHLNETLNLSQLSNGMYFLEIQTNEGSAFKKIMLRNVK